jgi:DedD protein
LEDSQEAPDAGLLKRRARRRLVGAVALVVFVVIALPIVLDREPKPITQDLTIQIPSQDATRFNSKLPPADAAPSPPPAAAPAGAAASAAPLTPSASPATAAKGAITAANDSQPAPATGPSATPANSAATTGESTKPADAAKPAAKPAPAKPAGKTTTRTEEAAKAVENGHSASIPTSSYFVPLGTYSKLQNVRQLQSKVSAVGIKSYSEKLSGSQIRLRAGPFANRDAAEQARGKLKSAGLDVGAVGQVD